MIQIRCPADLDLDQIRWRLATWCCFGAWSHPDRNLGPNLGELVATLRKYVSACGQRLVLNVA